MTTPKLILPEMASSTSQKHVLFNEAMQRVDAAVQLSVINATTTAPPVSPSDGDTYIVAATATGAWAGTENQIAAWFDGQWIFLDPVTGWMCYNQDTDTHLKFNGTAWVFAFSASGDQFGWQNYEDVTTQSTPIALTVADTWYDLTNDGAGSLSSEVFAPNGNGPIWDTATNAFDFTDLAVGDIVRIRVDVEFVTSATNHRVEMRLTFGPSQVLSLIHI